jgi:hypothetical protein
MTSPIFVLELGSPRGEPCASSHILAKFELEYSARVCLLNLMIKLKNKK